MRLVSLHVHPVKSCAGVSVDAFEVGPRGPLGDRRWMLVDDNGRFITAREEPSLVRVRPRRVSGGLRIEADGRTALSVAEPEDGPASQAVRIWKDDTTAGDAGDDAAAWFSGILGRSCRLVFQRDSDRRPIDSATGAAPGDEVSFADGYPLLLIGTASLCALNDRLDSPVTMDHFRPNIVVDTTVPFCEDDWSEIEIGPLRFAGAKRCSRCVLTTVDPATGEKDANGEPLRTLRGFRFDREARGILFGMNLIPRGVGRIAVGDAVRAA